MTKVLTPQKPAGIFASVRGVVSELQKQTLRTGADAGVDSSLLDFAGAMLDMQKGSDVSGVLGNVRDIIGTLQQQAKDGQIDAALLDQAGAMLDVGVDTAEDAQSSMSSGASTSSTGAGSSSGVRSATQATPNSSTDISGFSKEGSSSTPSSSSSSSSTGSTDPSGKPSVPTATGTSTPISTRNSSDETSSASDNVSSSSTTSTSPETPMTNVPSSSVGKFEDEAPLQNRPPLSRSYETPATIYDHSDDLRRDLPTFMKFMERGDMASAQRVAGYSQASFDMMFNMSLHETLNEGGVTGENLSKLGSMFNTTGDLAKAALTASTVPGIYLIRLAKLMLPVYAGLINRLPAGEPTNIASNQATWRAQLGFAGLVEGAGFRNAEAAIGTPITHSFLTFNAPFNDMAYSDSVTLKSLRATKGYADPLQISVINTMSALLRLQERVHLGSNYATIAANSGSWMSGSAIVAALAGSPAGTVAAGSYFLGITALTYEGWYNGAVGNSVTGSTSAQFGETNGIIISGSVAVSASGSSLNISWPALAGALAYNVYVAPTGSNGSAAVYQTTVVKNKVNLTSLKATGSYIPTIDNSVNALGIEGLTQWCEQSTVYGNAIPSKVSIYDNAGLGLTASNGGITQFDSVLVNAWQNWHTAPSVMIMSPNMSATLTGKILSLNNSSTYRIEVTNERNTINGGMMITGYTNKFAPFANGTPRFVDVIPHPYMPDGTVLFLSETIPYPMGNETRAFVRDVLLPYTYFPLASSTVQYNYSITTSETLECFNPSPQAAVVGVDYTL